MRIPVRWALALGTVSLLAVTSAAFAPAASADNSRSYTNLLDQEIHKFDSWFRQLVSLRAEVNKQGREISSLQAEASQQQQELSTVIQEVQTLGGGSGGQTQNISGTVVYIALASGDSPAVIDIRNTSNVTVGYTVPSTATIDGPIGPITLSDVHNGDSVQLVVSSGVVTSLVDTSATSSLQGSVMSFAAPASGRGGSLTIMPAGSGASAVYPVSASVTVYGPRYHYYADVTPGSEVLLSLGSGNVTSIDILHQAASLVSGQVMNFTPPAGAQSGLLVFLPNGSRSAQTYIIGAGVPIYAGNSEVGYGSLRVNVKAQLAIESSGVVTIEIP